MAPVRLTSRPPRRGAVLVELALILPILLLLTFGVIEYGWLFLKYNETNDAARRGARLGVMPDATSGQVTSAVSNSLNSSGMTDFTCTITPGDVEEVPPGETVTVEVDVTHARLTNFPLLPVPHTLHASVTMAKEGP